MNWSRRLFLRAAAGAAALPALAQSPASSEGIFTYVGSNTEGQTSPTGEGISVFRPGAEWPRVELEGTVRSERNPSFLATDPSRRFLYAVNDVSDFEGRPSGGVSAFAIDSDTGALTLLNRQPSMGANPRHLSVDPTGRFVLVANYSGGTIAVLPLQSDGSLGEATDVVRLQGTPGPKKAVQDGPHPAQVTTDPSGAFVIVNDVGLDRTSVFRLNDNGTLTLASELAAEPGSGPARLSYHPLGRWVYRINSLDNTMSALEWLPATAEFRNIEALSTVPESFNGENSLRNVAVAPFGKYVYGSNDGDESIALFNMDFNTGELTRLDIASSLGGSPGNFSIDPQGNFLFSPNARSNSVAVLKLDRNTGLLAGSGVNLDVAAPSAVLFVSKPVGVTARSGVLLSPFTNPIFHFDGTGLVRASITWNAPGVQTVEVRAGSVDGPLLGQFGSIGGLTTEKWVADGTTLFLQDVSGGKPLTSDNTLGSVRFTVRTEV
ncbi:MAG: lactonase family protein [Acidobacteria bacterium]|nr:lactonase family protein [Acidobacteriota bacterium]